LLPSREEPDVLTPAVMLTAVANWANHAEQIDTARIKLRSEVRMVVVRVRRNAVWRIFVLRSLSSLLLRVRVVGVGVWD
jgi:hypothetical protein